MTSTINICKKTDRRGWYRAYYQLNRAHIRQKARDAQTRRDEEAGDLTCPHCENNERLYTHTSLQRHIHEVHVGRNPATYAARKLRHNAARRAKPKVKCPFCPKMYTANYFPKHVALKHPQEQLAEQNA